MDGEEELIENVEGGDYDRYAEDAAEEEADRMETNLGDADAEFAAGLGLAAGQEGDDIVVGGSVKQTRPTKGGAAPPLRLVTAKQRTTTPCVCCRFARVPSVHGRRGA